MFCETFAVVFFIIFFFSPSILALSFVGRDNNSLEQANRKLERKMKEITMQVNDEQLSLQNQMDQVRARDFTIIAQCFIYFNLFYFMLNHVFYDFGFTARFGDSSQRKLSGF